jgi:hypothetical protein
MDEIRAFVRIELRLSLKVGLLVLGWRPTATAEKLGLMMAGVQEEEQKVEPLLDSELQNFGRAIQQKKQQIKICIYCSNQERRFVVLFFRFSGGKERKKSN